MGYFVHTVTFLEPFSAWRRTHWGLSKLSFSSSWGEPFFFAVIADPRRTTLAIAQEAIKGDRHQSSLHTHREIFLPRIFPIGEMK